MSEDGIYLSLWSEGSFLSVGSVLSYAAAGSVLSQRARDAILDEPGHRRGALLSAGILMACAAAIAGWALYRH